MTNNVPIDFQFHPKNWAFVEEVRTACKLLRSTGAEWIQNRKLAFQSGADVPKDILTQIIKSAGKGRLSKTKRLAVAKHQVSKIADTNI